MDAPFENGLMQIGRVGRVHLIHPTPKGIRPACKPSIKNADEKAIPVTHTDKPNCRDCIAIAATV